MAWLRVDDGMAEHRKILALKRGDRWTWMELLLYVARQNSGGHVPAGVCDVLRWVTPAFLKQCLSAGLLDVESDGYAVHDWDDYNLKDPTKAERQARWRAKRRQPVDGDVDADVDERVDGDVDAKATPPARARARGPSPSPKKGTEGPTEPRGDEDAPSRGASPPGVAQARNTKQRQPRAIKDAEAVAARWEGGSSEAFQSKLDAIAKEHRTTIPHLERDRLWQIAFPNGRVSPPAELLKTLGVRLAEPDDEPEPAVGPAKPASA